MARIGMAAVAALGLLGAGCSDDSAVRDAVEDAASDVEDAASDEVLQAMCRTEAATLETAAAAYASESGSAPESIDDLVGDYLSQPAKYHDDVREVSDGEFEAVPIPGAGCD